MPMRRQMARRVTFLVGGSPKLNGSTDSVPSASTSYHPMNAYAPGS